MADTFFTPAITIAGGLVVFGATQIAQRFWLDPATELMKALGRTSYALEYYANVYASPGVVREELSLEASRELRKCAAELLASLRGVRLYWTFRLLRQLPPKTQVKQAAKHLIGLANMSKKEEIREAWKEADALKSLLGLDPD